MPAGSYDSKVAINETWDENYGAGGVPGGDNISFTVPADNLKVTFSYDSVSHVLTITVAVDHGAPGGPGALSHFDLARKDCLGTARNRTSKVWYTVANGVLSDVYYPTVDNTNVETLQYIVTDGSTFTDLQTRDMTYAAAAINDTAGMACRVTATAKNGKYTISTDYITDPNRNTVLMRVVFTPVASGLQLFVRLDPTVNGNGGGGSGNGGADDATVDVSAGHPVLVASDLVTATNAANRDYAQPVFAALDGPFSAASSGFVGGPSDGLVQLDTGHALTPTFPDARDGNVVGTARVGLTIDGTAVLALGFGATRDEALGAASGSRAGDFTTTLAAYKKAWKSYDATLTRPRPEKLPGIPGPDQKKLEDAYYLSANVLKASEDKTFPGAIVASLASPWGQAISAGDPNNTYFGSYREVFARDLYEAWTGLVAAGDLATARDATLFLFQRQQLPDGSLPRNSLVNGKVAPDSFGTQLDEVAYPILMAQQLGLTDATLYADHIKPAANYLIAHGPAFGVERWEEQSGYSPSTIAAEIAGLVAAADLARANGDPSSAAVWLGVADDMQRSVKAWTVTTNGPLSSEPVLHPAVQERRPERGRLVRGRQRRTDARPATSHRRRVPRAGPSRPPPGQRPRCRPIPGDRGRHHQVDHAERPRLASLQRRRLRRSRHRRTPVGAQRPGDRPPVARAVRRASRTGPGRRVTRATAASLLNGMRKFASGVGLIPEQDWETRRRRPIAVRHGPDRRVDRFREREGGRLRFAADLVGGGVRPSRRRPRRGSQRGPPGGHAAPLRRAHAGDHDADRHEPR